MDKSIKMLKMEFREFCSAHLVLRQIDDIFSIAEFTEADTTVSISGERRSSVEAYYASADWEQPETIERFSQVIECALKFHFLSDDAKEDLRTMCRNNNFEVNENDDSVKYRGTSSSSDLFIQQFPAGLPFGVPKPGFAVKAKQGGQLLKFELQAGLGILSSNIYPNCDFHTLEETFGVNTTTNLTLKNALKYMNQTNEERDFFIAYARKFKMAERHIPVLIPQAWIQWHSHTKRKLHSLSLLDAEESYRVDFVAFWDKRRYIIFIDDIGHYAVKHGNQWIANEEVYTNNIKEERRLRRENWEVFRVSNWEVRNRERLDNALEVLRILIGFEE